MATQPILDPPTTTLHRPRTYWEERTANSEEALQRVMQVIADHLPAAAHDLNPIAREWARVTKEIDAEYGLNPPEDKP